MEAPCLTSFASFKAFALTLQMIPCAMHLQAQNPSWAWEKRCVSTISHPPSLQPAPNLCPRSLAFCWVVVLDQQQLRPAQVRRCASPGCQHCCCQLQSKKREGADPLPWARRVYSLGCKPAQKSCSSTGKTVRAGAGSPTGLLASIV